MELSDIQLKKLEDDFELHDMDIWFKKCGNKITLDFSMQYKLLKYRDTHGMVKLSNDINFFRRGAGLYVFYKNGLEYIILNCNELNKLQRAITFIDADDLYLTDTELRLRLQLVFLTYQGKGFKRLLTEMTLVRIPDNVKYSKEVFSEAYLGIDGKKFYRKCHQYRDCWMYEEFRHPTDFFHWFRMVSQYEIEMAVNQLMRDRPI